MPLSVKDGMGAWIKDFKDSNAPQFKGKSEKERRDMAIAAYMSAKRGGKPQEEGYVSAAQRKAVWANRADGGKGHPDKKNEATETPPFTGGQKRQDTVTDKSGAKHTPMSRARDLARKARDMQMKKESVEHLDEATVDTANIASKKAMKQSDMEKLGKVADMLAKERKPQKESVELDEAHAYAKAAKALHDYGTKNGGIDKKDFHAAAKHLDNIGKAGLMQKGAHIAKFNDHFKNLDTDVRDRIHMTLKQHGVMEAVSYYGNPNKDDDARNAARRKRLAKQDNKVKLKGFGPDAAKGNMGNPSVRAALKPKKEETQVEAVSYYGNPNKDDDARNAARRKRLAKQDNILKKRAQDNEKARQALKDPSHNPAWANSKSKVEAVSADRLKFAASGSKAVQDYMKKRADDRDAMNKKNDPNAAKKGYALSATPPERAYMKARKKGMSTGQARDAMAALAARKKNMSGRLPESAEDKMPATPDEKSMAMKQAEFIEYVAKEIKDHMKKNKEFPEWMQNKLSAFHQKSKDMHSTLGAHGTDEKDKD